MTDINPAFNPRAKPPSNVKKLPSRVDKGKAKATETSVKDGILSFFGPKAKIPQIPKDDRPPLSPIRPKKSSAGKDSGKRTLAEVMDREIAEKRRQKSRFFDAFTPVSQQATKSESQAIAGPSHQRGNKENIYVISDDEADSNVSIEAQGDADADMVIDLEDPSLCVVVEQEDGYMSQNSACSGDMQDLSSPVRPGVDSAVRRARLSPDLEFGADPVSSPPVAKRRRKSNSPIRPMLRTRSLDIPLPLQSLKSSQDRGELSVPSPKPPSFPGPDLRPTFADEHSSDIECSDEDETRESTSKSSTPPAPTPPTPVLQNDTSISDVEEEAEREHELRKKAVINGWQQRWSLGGRAKAQRASLPNLARRETNVTPAGRHTIPHSDSKLRRSAPYSRTAPNSTSKGTTARRSLVFLDSTVKGIGISSPSPSVKVVDPPITDRLDDDDDGNYANLFAKERLQRFR
ncbi:hypothetical protein H0H92_002406 [Tricholoma furcatifolium]|nr:hypothetical protein H0H92_002406 [Tricholoma furcatifolium]